MRRRGRQEKRDEIRWDVSLMWVQSLHTSRHQVECERTGLAHTRCHRSSKKRKMSFAHRLFAMWTMEGLLYGMKSEQHNARVLLG